jgi:hypothetical protein
MSEVLKLLVSNISGSVRRVQSRGRTYVVVPVSMINPGVLNGSDGPGLYPLDEVSRDPDNWNIMPVVVNHPVDEQGRPASARHPHVLEKVHVGNVYSARIAEGRLAGEAWLDEVYTNSVDNRIIPRLERGEQLEVSTGLFLRKVPDQGVHNGVAYTFVARNYRPDHLAILPDGKGACALEHGCGLNVNQAPDEKRTLLQRLGTLLGLTNDPPPTPAPAPTGNEENDVDRTATINWLVANCDCWKGKEKVLQNTEAFTNDDLNRLKASAEKNAQTAQALAVANTQATDARKPFEADGKVWTWNEMAKAWEGKTKEQPTQVQNADPILTKLAALLPKLEQVINRDEARVGEEKASLIGRLTANLHEPQKAAHVAVYNTMTVDQLRPLAALAPTPAGPPVYVGGGVPTQTTNQGEEELEGIGPTANNYGELAAPGLVKVLH